MKKTTVSIITAFLIIFYAVGTFSASAIDAPKNPYIRVGINYDSTAKAAFNIFNPEKYAYEFGVYDQYNNFYTAYTTDRSKSNTGYFISVSKDVPLYYSYDQNLLSDTSFSGSTRLGNIHLETGTKYTDAAAAANTLKAVQNKGLTAFIAKIPGYYKIRIGMYNTKSDAENDITRVKGILGSGESLTAVGKLYDNGIEDTVTVVDMNIGKIIFEYSGHTAPGDKFGVRVKQQGTKESFMKINSRYYRGVMLFERPTNNNVTMVSALRLEDYLRGVVPWEMSPSWNIEALKAQAVCARNFTLNAMSSSRHEGQPFDICATTHCQAYYGNERENDNTNKAVSDTKNQVLTYNNKLASLYYSASGGGSSEDAKYVWGGDAVAYLAAVQDDFELKYISETYGTKYRNSISPSELADKFRSKNIGVSGNVEDVWVEERTPIGKNVYKLGIRDSAGSTFFVTNTDKVRTALSGLVKSPKFYIDKTYEIYCNIGDMVSLNAYTTNVITANGVVPLASDKNITVMTGANEKVQLNAGKTSSFVFDGKGNGHAVGMSQYGARARAEAGHTYQQILTFYFSGTKLETIN